jgi:transcriptional regulator with XRE-family HTH domain
MRDKFTRIREAKGKNQSELALSVNLSVSTVSGFESGRVNDFSPRTRSRLAEAYGVSIDEINDACGIRSPSTPAA